MTCARALPAALCALTLGACQPPPVGDPLSWSGRTTENGDTAADASTASAPAVSGAPAMAPAVTPENRQAPGAASAPAEPPPRPSDAAAGNVDTRAPARPDAAATPSVTCKLAVVVTTATTNRDYRPQNIGAIWIADEGGRFVKTLKVWAGERASHLNRWGSVSAAAGLARNKVDAVTGATVSSHRMHTASWNCTNTKKEPVADGTYQVCMEMTESNAAGPTSCVTFVKGPEPARLMPADTANFKSRTFEFTP